MERQFNRRHGAVTRKFEVKDPVYVRHRHSQDWKAASVSQQIRGRLYDVTLIDGSTCRFHVNQMRPRSTHQTEDHFVDFCNSLNLPVPRTKVAREETEPEDEQAANIHPETSSQELTQWDNNSVEQPSKGLVEPRRSKQGHIPKSSLNWTQTRGSTNTHRLAQGTSPVFFLPGFPS
jgi:hypothetical protein